MLCGTGGMTIAQATLFNFLSSLSAMAAAGATLGVLAGAGSVSHNATGLILCYGAGVYIAVAYTSLLPDIFGETAGCDQRPTRRRLLQRVASFLVGVVILALVLQLHGAHGCRGLLRPRAVEERQDE